MKFLKTLGKAALVFMGAYDLITWQFVPFTDAESWGWNMGSLFVITVAGWIIYREFFKKKEEVK